MVVLTRWREYVDALELGDEPAGVSFVDTADEPVRTEVLVGLVV